MGLSSLDFWLDGSKVDYTNWNLGEPNDSCFSMDSGLDYKWVGIHCVNELSAFVCKIGKFHTKAIDNNRNAKEVLQTKNVIMGGFTMKTPIPAIRIKA